MSLRKRGQGRKTKLGGKRLLAARLVQQGFKELDAERAVDAIFAILKRTLIRHESIEVPLGRILIQRQREYRAWSPKLRGRTVSYGIVRRRRQKYKIVFKLDRKQLRTFQESCSKNSLESPSSSPSAA